MRRPFRLDPYYRCDCNGGRDNQGCAWMWHTSKRDEARAVAERHAEVMEHEVVVSNVNDGLVLDGRPR